MYLSRIALSLTGGSIIGWIARREIVKHGSKASETVKDDDFRSWTYLPTPWNDNWDRRAPSSLLNARTVSKGNDKNNNNGLKELKDFTPAATRHL